MTKPLRHLKYPKVPRLLSAVLKVTAPVVMGIMAVALPIAIGFPDITIWSVGFLVAFLLLDLFVSVCVSVVKDIWAQLDREMGEMTSGEGKN